MSALCKDTQTLAISSTGRARSLDSFDERVIYHSTFPEVATISMINIAGMVYHTKVSLYLRENSWSLIRQNKLYELEGNSEEVSKELWIHDDGYMIVFNGNNISVENPRVSDFLQLSGIGFPSHSIRKKRVSVIDAAEIYYPTDFIGNTDHEKFVNELLQTFSANYMTRNKEATISIISQDGRDFYAKKFSLKGQIPPSVHLDEHYGDGFTGFYSDLLDRIDGEKKGLILFHGEPGTGKTQFIRMLLEKLTSQNKSILYAPPSLSAQLTEPHMIEFISDWVIDEERDCILLIEDAEPLLETRNGDGRSTGISNLLNITDGILNDMLGLMVIATFNTDIAKIDSALLRPQRLIARKEFNKLRFDQGERLAEALGIGNPLDVDQYPASLAEFYSAQKQTQILIHEVKHKKQIGFK